RSAGCRPVRGRGRPCAHLEAARAGARRVHAMTHDAMQTVRHFGSLNVLVVGEAMLDSYLIGTSTRLCREAPAPIVDITRRVDAGGGAANTAANASALGASVSLLTVFGTDEAGGRLASCLASAGV